MQFLPLLHRIPAGLGRSEQLPRLSETLSDAEALRAVKPSLIYCTLGAFGRNLGGWRTGRRLQDRQGCDW